MFSIIGWRCSCKKLGSLKISTYYNCFESCLLFLEDILESLKYVWINVNVSRIANELNISLLCLKQIEASFQTTTSPVPLPHWHTLPWAWQHTLASIRIDESVVELGITTWSMEESLVARMLVLPRSKMKKFPMWWKMVTLMTEHDLIYHNENRNVDTVPMNMTQQQKASWCFE